LLLLTAPSKSAVLRKLSDRKVGLRHVHEAAGAFTTSVPCAAASLTRRDTKCVEVHVDVVPKSPVFGTFKPSSRSPNSIIDRHGGS